MDICIVITYVIMSYRQGNLMDLLAFRLSINSLSFNVIILMDEFLTMKKNKILLLEWIILLNE